MSSRGRLVVISGPSGAGKSTICRELLEYPDFARVITATTRAPRGKERNGVDYHFLSRAEFEQGIKENRFLEHAEVYGHFYGTPRDQVEAGIRRGNTMILNIDVQGARQLREARIDDMTTVFIEPPSFEVLGERLLGRGTESKEAVDHRLRQAREEMREKSAYEHAVVNDDLKSAVAEVLQVLGRSTSSI